MIVGAGFAAVTAAAGDPSQAPPPTAPLSATAPVDWSAQRAEAVRVVWETVATSYYEDAWDAAGWDAARTRFAPQVEAAADAPALRDVLNAMLGTLGRTHFAVWPATAGAIAEASVDGPGSTGVELAMAGGEVVAWRVMPDSPAARAGVRRGDVCRVVAGEPVEELRGAIPAEGTPTAARRDFYLVRVVEAQLSPAVGAQVSVEWLRPGRFGRSSGRRRTTALTAVAYTGRWSEPLGHMPALPLACERAALAGAPAYLRFNLFAPALMAELRTFLTDLPAETPGLVIDLRGNPGGIGLMASGLAGWLSTERYLLGTMRLRTGHLNFAVFPQERAYAGPVAVLIDARSASTSELLAAGLREAGRARIFGETSAGAALPSMFRRLPTGDLFQYAIADLRTPQGVSIEGRGVVPDVIVVPTPGDLAAGRDPARAAAETWLRTEATAKR